MVSKTILEKYARLAVVHGANVQKGQLLVIRSSVETYEFARMCQKEAYLAGASDVWVYWSDPQMSHNDMLYGSLDEIAVVPEWEKMRQKEAQEKKCAYLNITSTIPGLMDDCDSERMMAVTRGRMEGFKPYRKYTMASQGQWTIVAIPNVTWAKKVFPNESDEVALDHLWNAILKACYIDEEHDPIETWIKHSNEIKKHCELMNEYNFKTLHFENELGTDLYVDLCKDHIWGGGSELATVVGCEFEANIPTEEIFTTPSRTGVNGKVVASKPLNENGHLIENFYLEFKDGKVVNYYAEKEMDALKELIERDENSCRLGEVALLSYDSPINQLDILFYDTLFDENASCHLALGASYPTQIKNGATMSDDDLLAHDANVSSVHCDFMFGSRKMHVTGEMMDGTIKDVFVDGNFVI